MKEIEIRLNADLNILGVGKKPIEDLSLSEPIPKNNLEEGLISPEENGFIKGSTLIFVAVFIGCLVAGWLWLRVIRKR